MKARYGILPLAALSICLASVAFAAKTGDPESVAPLANPTCSLNGYKVESQTLTPRFDIPDNGRTQLVVGTIPAVGASGEVLIDVMPEVTIAHTWVGDLILQLDYMPCGGGPSMASAKLLCRPRGTGTTIPAPCGTGTGFGASGNLGGAGTAPIGELPYLFQTDAAAGIADGTNPATIPAGCYKPNTPLSVFSGLPKNGCFVLSVSDWAAGDLGYITAWKVYMTNDQPVPTASRTWGQVKTTYR